MNLKYFLFASSAFFLASCGEKESVDCNARLKMLYENATFSNCQVRDDNSIFVGFRESDTLIFSYTGNDTLVFEHRDSLGNLDTVEYIGQGKNSKIAPGKAGDFDDPCVAWVDASYFSIDFLPNKPKHKRLFFDLLAVGSSSYFTYEFMNIRLNTGTWGIEDENTIGYLPVFNFRGQEFYHVTETKVASADGLNASIFISKESQLVFLIASDSSYYLKIN